MSLSLARGAAWMVATAAAGVTCAPSPEPANVPPGQTSAAGDGSSPAPVVTPTKDPPPDAGASFGCRLPAPVKSGDTCSSDGDCAPSDPCHARACVGRARANPPQPGTICTKNLDCLSVDVNRCGCLEGVCALVPPT